MNKCGWLSALPSAKTAGCIHFCRLRMDLSTFSTGFSTENVKKAPVFPRCFPLFPLSFPHFLRGRFIRDVFSGGSGVDFSGRRGLFHLFSERKSRPRIYFLHFSLRLPSPILPFGIRGGRVFHSPPPRKKPCGKPRENSGFPQNKTAPAVPQKGQRGPGSGHIILRNTSCAIWK